jgi:succinate dehydrogenase/fumarate reductase flavoprotein subunit
VGLGLSYLYITTGYTPPVLQPADELQSGLNSMLADALFEGGKSDLRQRQRAVALLIGENPELYLELDDRIDQAMTKSLVEKKLERVTALLRGQREAFLKQFASDKYPALKHRLQEVYGTGELNEMAAHLLAGNIAKDEFVADALRNRYPGMDLLQIAREILK